MTIKFPEATVNLNSVDGNAFSILAAVRKALRDEGATQEEVKTYIDEATSGDYDNLLQVSMRWVNVE